MFCAGYPLLADLPAVAILRNFGYGKKNSFCSSWKMISLGFLVWVPLWLLPFPLPWSLHSLHHCWFFFFAALSNGVCRICISALFGFFWGLGASLESFCSGFPICNVSTYFEVSFNVSWTRVWLQECSEHWYWPFAWPPGSSPDFVGMMWLPLQRVGQFDLFPQVWPLIFCFFVTRFFSLSLRVIGRALRSLGLCGA